MFKIMPKGGLPPAPPPPEPPQGPPQLPPGAGPPPPDDAGPLQTAGAPPDDTGGLPKLSQGLVVYMGAEDGPFACGHCLYFSAPSSCQLVDGDVEADGCCNLYTPGGTPDGDTLDPAPETAEPSPDQPPPVNPQG